MYGHSDVIEGLVPTWSDIRVVAILGMEAPGQLLGMGSSLVDQYHIMLVHIVGFKIIKNWTNIL